MDERSTREQSVTSLAVATAGRSRQSASARDPSATTRGGPLFPPTREDFEKMSVDALRMKIVGFTACINSLDHTDETMHPAIARLDAMRDVASAVYGLRMVAVPGDNALRVPGAGTVAEATQYQSDLHAAQVEDGTAAAAATMQPAPLVHVDFAAAHVVRPVARARGESSPASPPNGQKFLSDCDEAQMQAALEHFIKRMKSNHADLWEKVEKNIDPRTLCLDMIKALSDQSGSENGKAIKTHAMQVNGNVQKGKSNVKLFMGTLAYEINQDPEWANKPYTFWVTPMVPWAEKAVNDIKRGTTESRIIKGKVDNYDEDEDEDEFGDDDSSESGDYVDGRAQGIRGIRAGLEDDDELDTETLEHLPVSGLNNKAAFAKALQVADSGGIVVLPRTEGSLKKCGSLKIELELQCKKEKRPLAQHWFACDEFDKCMGSCNWAGHDTDVEIRITNYERYFWAMLGVADSGKGFPISFWDPRKGKLMEGQRCIARRYKPFLFMGITATGAGSFQWLVHRVGTKHKTKPGEPEQERFHLLDVVSMKPGTPEEYVCQLDAVKFKNLELQPQELGTHNFYNNDKTLAIESNCMQTPRASIMMATTTTVSADAQTGCASTRVNAVAVTNMLVGGEVNDEVCGQQVGYTKAGALNIFMHGDGSTFPGCMGVEFVAPDDPVGLKWFEKMRALGKKKMRRHRACQDKIEKQLDDEGLTARLTLEKNKIDRKLEDYRLMISEMDERLLNIRPADVEIRRLNAGLVNVITEEKRKRAALDQAKQAPAEERLNQEELSRMESECHKLSEEAAAMRLTVADQRHKLAWGRTSADSKGFKKNWIFAIEMLRPMIQDWEDQRKAVNPNYVKEIPDPKKKAANSQRYAPVIKCSMICAVLTFFRSLDHDDDMRELVREEVALQPTPGLTDSESIPIKIVGYNMLRRAMSIIAALLLISGESDPLLTLTHVCQYASDLDGASSAQQVERFATILASFLRKKMGDRKIMVLSGTNAWLSMKGHRAFNMIKLFHMPDEERHAKIAEMVQLLKGERDLPQHDPETEDRLNALADTTYEVKKDSEHHMTATNERVMRVLAECIQIPQELYDMCDQMKKPMFAANAGRDYGHVMARAAEGAAALGNRQLTPRLAPAPKKKKKRVPENYVDNWSLEALEALSAYCPRDGPYTHAVGHGKIWDKVVELNGHLLRDPEMVATLREEQAHALTILNKEQHRTGGLGLALTHLVNKGKICRLAKEDAANPLRQMGRCQIAYFIPTDGPNDLLFSPEAASLAAANAAASAAAAVASAAAAAAAAGPSSNKMGKQPMYPRAAAAAGVAKRKSRKDWDSDSVSDLDDQMIIAEDLMPRAQLQQPKKRERAVAIDDESDDESEDGKEHSSESDDDSDDGDDNVDFHPDGGDSDNLGDDSDGDYPTSDEEEEERRATVARNKSSEQKRKLVNAKPMHTIPAAVANKEQVTNSKKIDARLPEGWTQWTQSRRGSNQRFTSYLAPDNVHLFDSFKSRQWGNGGRKEGIWDFCERKGLPMPHMKAPNA